VSLNRPILLVGMPGVGKSTVGRLVADELHVPLSDTDAVVERAAGSTIAEIFARAGEQEFRRRETAALSDALRQCHVVSAGGGAPVQQENRDLLAQAWVVHLVGDAAEVWGRLHHSSGRPLLAGGRPAWERLWAERASVYAAVSDVTVPVTGRAPEQIAQDILSAARTAGVAGVDEAEEISDDS